MAVRLVEDGIHPVRLFPSAKSVPFGRRWHARGRGHCRGKPGTGTGRAPEDAQEYRAILYRLSEQQIRRGRREARSSTNERELNPCA